MDEVNPKLTKLIDYAGGNNPVYIGWARSGTATSSAKWKIKKLVYSGSNVYEYWADYSNRYNKVWSLRATYAYGP